MPTSEPFKNPDYWPFGVNNYVPALQGLADVGHDYEYLADFGILDTLQAAGILAALTAVGTTKVPAEFAASIPGIDSSGVIAARWGRDITAVASGAATNVITITGYDYLGQKIVKAKALNGATPIAFGVAFKRIESIVSASGGAATFQVGFSNAFGLPYRTARVAWEQADGENAAAGTLTAPVLTDPATNASGDPRGLYPPTTTPNSAKRIVALLGLMPMINAAGNGGLHGIKHYGG